MSFRKRNIPLASGSARSIDQTQPPAAKVAAPTLPGVRPSPLDGRPTTSTGTATLDSLLAGHAGLALGTSLLIEESGTTDYAGALLRYYAAEGLVQGHHVHVVGLPEQWGRNLPGLVARSEKGNLSEEKQEKMKIAWRYESLGQLGDGQASRERAPQRAVGEAEAGASPTPAAFCHSFDLTKKLVHPENSTIKFLRLGADPKHSPFAPVLDLLLASLKNSTADTVHRVVLPSLLSSALYSPHASLPQHVLQFLREIRTLLATYQGRLTVMASMPLSLFPRSSGAVRWIELLNDGVMELSPFPHSAEAESSRDRGPGTFEEPPQGLLRVHRLPILHERGSGIIAAEDDWAFSLSRRNFAIKPFSLPPVEGDTEAQETAGIGKKGKKADLEF